LVRSTGNVSIGVCMVARVWVGGNQKKFFDFFLSSLSSSLETSACDLDLFFFLLIASGSSLRVGSSQKSKSVTEPGFGFRIGLEGD
jgi:hypothetical protein